MREVMFVAAIALAGCAATPELTDERATPPDFTLEAIVLRGSAAAPSVDPNGRPVHYVLFPDGSLHASDWVAHATGVDVEPEPPQADSLPERVRVLSTADLDEVWLLVRELGFSGTKSEGSRESASNLALLAPPPDGVLLGIAVMANGASTVTVTSASAPDRSAATDGAAKLVARLAHLAWLDEPSAGERRYAPRRYDFGPDPYARYRKP